MKKLFSFFAAVLMAFSVMAQDEIGGIVGGLNGVSYKHWFTEQVALQADLAVGLTAVPMIIYVNGVKVGSGTNSQYDFTLNPNILGHVDLAPNFKFYSGAGLNIGLVSDLSNTNPDAILGKAGINVVAGFSYDVHPVVIAFDFRPGYGLGFHSSNILEHFMDWKLGLAVRYRL